MTTITERAFEQDPLAYLRRVEAGESFLVVRDGRAVAEIKPVPVAPSQPRPHGLCAGSFTAPADFDAPLPDDLLEEFGNG